MPEEPHWEQVCLERPIGGFYTATYRMKVPGGWPYHTIFKYSAFLGARYETSMPFVPANAENQ